MKLKIVLQGISVFGAKKFGETGWIRIILLVVSPCLSGMREQGQAMSWFVNLNGSSPSLPSVLRTFPSLSWGRQHFLKCGVVPVGTQSYRSLRKEPVSPPDLPRIFFSGQVQDRVWSEAGSTYLISCRNLFDVNFFPWLSFPVD
jgi:hypothetical protein